MPGILYFECFLSVCPNTNPHKDFHVFYFRIFGALLFSIMTNKESPSVKKMISDLTSEGFSFHEDFDEINEYRFGKLYRRRRLENVVFEKEGVVIKINNDLFFRVTGLSHLFDESIQKPVKVSDDEFYEIQKHLIRYRFEQQIKHPNSPESEISTPATIQTEPLNLNP